MKKYSRYAKRGERMKSYKIFNQSQRRQKEWGE